MAESEGSKPDKPPAYSAWAAPAGIVAALAALNCAILWFYPDAPPPDFLEAVFLGAWVFQPMLLGVWTALGPGRLVTRAPLVVPCLMLIIAAPSVGADGFDDVERSEFIIIIVAAMAILAAMTAILYVARWFAGWRILMCSQATGDQLRLQFNIKYLLTLITLYAVTLGIISTLQFEPPDPSPFFGPDFFLHVAAIGGSAISAALLPVVAVPLLILTPFITSRFVLLSTGFWALVTTVMALIGTFFDGTSFADIVKWIVVMQTSAAVLGTCSALALRVSGYRLVSVKPPLPVDAPTEP